MGTPAAKRNDQVSAQVVSSRARELRELASCLRKEEYEKRRGSVELAVVEDANLAMTDSYYEIPAPEDSLPGQIVQLCL